MSVSVYTYLLLIASLFRRPAQTHVWYALLRCCYRAWCELSPCCSSRIPVVLLLLLLRSRHDCNQQQQQLLLQEQHQQQKGDASAAGCSGIMCGSACWGV